MNILCVCHYFVAYCVLSFNSLFFNFHVLAVKGKVLETKANRDNSQLIVKIEILKYLRRTRPGRRKGNLFKVRVPLTNPRNCNAYSKRPYLIIRKQRGKKATAVVLKWRKYRRLHKAARCSN